MIFRFDIEPKPVQSFRFAAKNGHVVKFQKKDVLDYKNFLRLQAIDQENSAHFYTDKPIVVRSLVFAFPWLSNATKKQKSKGWAWKSTKPDLDNLEKGLWDALQGVLFVNDSQICVKCNVKKIYCDRGYIELDIVTVDEYENESEKKYNGDI